VSSSASSVVMSCSAVAALSEKVVMNKKWRDRLQPHEVPQPC
jgi:hypothetical protein